MSMTRKRVKADVTRMQRFGHCMPTFDQEAPEESHKACPGERISSVSTANYEKGTLVKCECTCHGEDREAWPGRHTALLGVVAPPDDVDEETPEAETPEGTDDPSDEDSEALSEPLVIADTPPERETKRIKYKEGSVARVEVDTVDKKNRDRTFVKWVAYDLQDARLGEHWSLKDAKDAIGAK